MDNQKVLIGVVGLFAVALLTGSLDVTDITGNVVGFPGWSYCSSSNLCGHGEGDCDNDNQCQSGLTCEDDVGASYYGSRYRSVDVCEGFNVVPAGKTASAGTSPVYTATDSTYITQKISGLNIGISVSTTCSISLGGLAEILNRYTFISIGHTDDINSGRCYEFRGCTTTQIGNSAESAYSIEYRPILTSVSDIACAQRSKSRQIHMRWDAFEFAGVSPLIT